MFIYNIRFYLGKCALMSQKLKDAHIHLLHAFQICPKHATQHLQRVLIKLIPVHYYLNINTKNNLSYNCYMAFDQVHRC